MNQERVRREGKEERRNFGPSLRGQKNPLEFQLFFLVFFLFTVFFFFFSCWLENVSYVDLRASLRADQTRTSWI